MEYSLSMEFLPWLFSATLIKLFNRDIESTSAATWIYMDEIALCKWDYSYLVFTFFHASYGQRP